LIPYEEVGYILDFTPFYLSIKDIDDDHEVQKNFLKYFSARALILYLILS